MAGKACVLDAAMKYMVYLQQRVTTLEEQIRVKESFSGAELILPEIKARICNQTVLVKIRCGKRKGRIVDILGEVESHNLAILNFNVATLSTSALDLTIIAKMENESSPSEVDLVTAIRHLL